MISLRPSADRGRTKIDWLDSWHSFSFNEYYDPQYSSFRHLRVINEDFVSPGMGFATHGHRDMEIITYVLEGALEHKDNMGNQSVIRPGEVQRMSAGTGVLHSEFNPSSSASVHLLQIWIRPEKTSLPPSYEQKAFPIRERSDSFVLLASPKGEDGSITIHQDVSLLASYLKPGSSVDYNLLPERHAWVQVARGQVMMNNITLQPGDGAAVSEESALKIQNISNDSAVEVLLIDLS